MGDRDTHLQLPALGHPRLAILAMAVLAAAAAAAVGGGVWLARGPVVTGAAPRATTGSLARVTRTDLATTQQVPGTIGYGASSPIAAPGGSTTQALDQARTAADAASQKLTADQTAAQDQVTTTRQAIAQAQAQLTADQTVVTSDQQKLQSDQQKEQTDCASPTSPACVTDQQAVAADQQKLAVDQARAGADQATVSSDQTQLQQKQDQGQAQVAADQAALADANQALGHVQGQAVHGNVFTALPQVGQTVAQGQALYSVDGHPVPLLIGPVAMYRRLAAGVSGQDVLQLEQDLLQLGYATPSNLAADGTYTAADQAAVQRWQAAIGAPRTGEVWLGDAVFLAGPVRVTAVHAAVGAQVQPGQTIVDVTSANRVVTVQLDPALAYTVHTGDAVTIALPGGKATIPGTVSVVSTVAQQVPGSTSQTPNGSPQSTIPVTIAPGSTAQLPDLDSAPVSVNIATQSARNVLAVPVNALLALQGGGYAVQVPNPGGGSHLVPVTTGIFDNSLVQVSGPGLAAGMSVVVPG